MSEDVLFYGRIDTKVALSKRPRTVLGSFENFETRLLPLLEPLVDPTSRRSWINVDSTDGRPLVSKDLRDWNWVDAGRHSFSRPIAEANGGYMDNSSTIAKSRFRAVSKQVPGTADELSIIISPSVLSEPLIEASVEWFVDAAQSSRASTGFLTLDQFVYDSPYEAAVGLRSIDSLAVCDRYTRGYYWGTLLSAGHLEALGGITRVLRDAPVWQARDISASDHPLVYLQLTEHLTTFSEDDLAKLRSFLQPVIRPREPHSMSGYIGPPLRLVSEDLERRIPVEVFAPVPPNAEQSTLTVLERESASWEGLEFALTAASLTEPRRSQLEELVHAWYTLASRCAFGGFAHSASNLAYDQTADNETVARWIIDMGTTPPEALAALIRTLESFVDDEGLGTVTLSVG